MGMLIKNEFYKLKREWFMAFLLLLSLLPILTGGAGAVFNNSTKSLADLFFFMNNQFSMFFPMVIFILIGSLFYQEYKNKTYINWITYGFSKKKLFLSKVAVSTVISIGFAVILFVAFGLLVAILNGTGRLTGGVSLFLNLAIGFGIEACVIVLITTCLGAIVINLSRNIIVTSVVGVILALHLACSSVRKMAFSFRVVLHIVCLCPFWIKPLIMTPLCRLLSADVSVLYFALR